jgi:hypothetical protein
MRLADYYVSYSFYLKPRLTSFRSFDRVLWECTDLTVYGYGDTPAEAFGSYAGQWVPFQDSRYG